MFRLKLKQGGFRWFQARGLAYRDEAGGSVRIAGSIRDVTQIRSLVAEKQQQVERRDVFLATLSHELRNPLGAVVTAVRLLQQLNAENEIQCQAIGIIDRQAAQMAALLNDLLDVARISEGKVELRKSPARLQDIVRESAEAVQSLYDNRSQTLRVELPDESVWVEGDAVRLRQIIGNLLSNASKYSPAGESVRVQLNIEHPAGANPSDGAANDGSIGHIGATSAGDRVAPPPIAVVRVIDHGLGVAPHLQDRIFQPFEQLQRTHEQASGGLGLGLSLARMLSELHGGSVSIFSRGEGCGSEFSIRLPTIAEPAGTSGAGEQAEHAVDGQSCPPLSIVLIEDNADARDMLRALLESCGHQVRVAGDGKAGLDLIRQTQPAAAIVDVGLPGMDGYAVARSVRAESALESTTLVALTGYGQVADREAALEAGFNCHITKPLSFAALQQALRQAAVARQAD